MRVGTMKRACLLVCVLACSAGFFEARSLIIQKSHGIHHEQGTLALQHGVPAGRHLLQSPEGLRPSVVANSAEVVASIAVGQGPFLALSLTSDTRCVLSVLANCGPHVIDQTRYRRDPIASLPQCRVMHSHSQCVRTRA